MMGFFLFLPIYINILLLIFISVSNLCLNHPWNIVSNNYKLCILNQTITDQKDNSLYNITVYYWSEVVLYYDNYWNDNYFILSVDVCIVLKKIILNNK